MVTNCFGFFGGSLQHINRGKSNDVDNSPFVDRFLNGSPGVFHIFEFVLPRFTPEGKWLTPTSVMSWCHWWVDTAEKWSKPGCTTVICSDKTGQSCIVLSLVYKMEINIDVYWCRWAWVWTGGVRAQSLTGWVRCWNQTLRLRMIMCKGWPKRTKEVSQLILLSPT